MKKKNGFTLVELLAVTIILVTILMVTFPTILASINRQKENQWKNTVSIITAAAEMYVEDHRAQLPELDVVDTAVIVPLSTLIDMGLLKWPLKDPRDNKELDIGTGVKVSLTSDRYLVYTYPGDCPDGKCVVAPAPELPSCTCNVTPGTCDKGCFCDFECNTTPSTPGTANAPELTNNMIPVVYDTNTNSWKVADTSTKWYDYDNKVWANSVTVTTASRSKYSNGDGTYKKDVQVAESDVLTYLVWIPRYKYKLFNVSATSMTPKMIEVVFENKTTPKSQGTSNGEYLTHPAFSWDRNSDGSYSADEELNGIWVGKFETTGSTANPTVKPNLPAVAKVNIKALFDMSLKFSATSNYGLETLNDSHMMKNTEWGAVAYLTNSKYGRYKENGTCIESGCEVWINNVYISGKNYYSITGCVGASVSAPYVTVVNDLCPAGYEYNSTTGPKASTTGNIYGIYDMSGGHYEYVMGNMKDTSANFYPSNSGFSTAPARKYYDLYNYGTTYNDQAAYDRRIMGDATGEVRGWNSDYAHFPYSTSSWFIRGGNSTITTIAGVASFNHVNGGANSNFAARLVVAPR